VTSCGEENLLMLAEDRYRYENILVGAPPACCMTPQI
jgi:hypothetical protein